MAAANQQVRYAHQTAIKGMSEIGAREASDQ
jgi:hypothetical protein